MKRKLIVGLILLGIIGIFLLKNSTPNYSETHTNLGIKSISGKSKEEEIYYLMVVIDDYYVENYSLPCNEFKMQTRESIYEKVTVNSECVGVSLVVPYFETLDEFAMMLKEKNTVNWMIVGVTMADNHVIR